MLITMDDHTLPYQSIQCLVFLKNIIFIVKFMSAYMLLCAGLVPIEARRELELQVGSGSQT